MKYLITIMVLIALIAGCTQTAEVDMESVKEELMQADRDFAAMSLKESPGKAFEFYADPEAIMFQDRDVPVVGSANIGKSMSTIPPEVVFQWEPYKAEVGSGGDLGYTVGKWKYTVTDSTGVESGATGHYVSIWKKQEDGSWKFVLDAGSSDPPEKKVEEEKETETVKE